MKHELFTTLSRCGRTRGFNPGCSGIEGAISRATAGGIRTDSKSAAIKSSCPIARKAMSGNSQRRWLRQSRAGSPMGARPAGRSSLSSLRDASGSQAVRRFSHVFRRHFWHSFRQLRSGFLNHWPYMPRIAVRLAPLMAPSVHVRRARQSRERYTGS